MEAARVEQVSVYYFAYGGHLKIVKRKAKFMQNLSLWHKFLSTMP